MSHLAKHHVAAVQPGSHDGGNEEPRGRQGGVVWWAVWMETVDHRKTASWGSSKRAEAYRAKQDALINSGKLREAIQMDIDDIRSLFGNKYDANIKQMLESFGFSE